MYISPNSGATLTVLTVSVKTGCLIGGSRLQLIRCSFIHLEIFEVHISTAQARRNWWAAAGSLLDYALIVVLRAFSGLVTFCGRQKGHFVARAVLWTWWWLPRRSLISWQVR